MLISDWSSDVCSSDLGNILREAAGGGLAWISSQSKRASPGSTIDVPLAHKDALYVRSHYDGMATTLHDAPHDDEIAVICCYANRGRLTGRLSGLGKDEIELRSEEHTSELQPLITPSYACFCFNKQ